MKAIIVMLLSLAIFGCKYINGNHSVEIVDYRNAAAPKINPELHSDKDVEIFRTDFMGDFFSVIIYRMDGGRLKGYQGFMEAKNNYNRAEYNWANDSTVNITFFDPTNKLTEVYSMSGFGETTALNWK